MRTRISVIFFLLIFMTKIANAQTTGDRVNLNYTYLGPVFSVAHNKVEYMDWFPDPTDNTKSSTETKKMSGTIISGGLTFNIFADRFCGDLQIKYAVNSLEETLKYIEVSAAGKYFFYKINNYFALGGGFGMYLEIPTPDDKNNGSAGLQLPLTILVETSRDTKLFLDVYGRYGTFGIGENTNSISVGTNIGFIFKVGRV